AHTKRLLEASLEKTKALQDKEKELQKLLDKVNKDKSIIELNNQNLAAQITVTERLQLELAVRTHIINQVAIVTETDLYGTITYVNEKFCEVSKYSAAELIGKPHNIVRHPDNPSSLFENMWETIKSGKVFYATYRNKAKDGSTYWVEATVAPIFNEHQEIIKYIGVRFDVTEKIEKEELQERWLQEIQKQREALLASEEELRQNLEELQTTQEQLITSKDLFENKQKQLQRFLNSIPSYLYEAELDLATQAFHTRLNNKAGEEIYGISQAELEQNGGSIFRVILPEDVVILQNAVTAAINTQQSQQVEYRIKKGEEIRWLHGTMLPNMTAHNTVLFTGIVQDITAKKIAEQKQVLLQKLFDSTNDAVQACSEDGRFMYMNTTAAQRFGIKAEDCSNYFVKDLEAVFAEEGSWEAHVAELKTLKSLVIESANTNLQTGETVFVEVSVQHIVIEGEGFMVATSRNVTERKKQEQLIQQQNEALLASEEELRQNLEELQATQEKLITLQEEERKANEIFKALFEFSSNPHLLFDETGIIDCNNATIQLLGYQSKRELLKLHPAKLSPERQPDGRLSGEKAVEMDRIAHEKGLHRFEWIHRKAD
ncbi:MAG: PAS domain S-box protein, partial [Thermoflexibacteraceae bacterium]